jgi:four helix bundle protein
MKYERFEDLPAWKVSVDLGLRIYAMTRDRFFAQAGDLRSQLRRAALSVSNNIAEGFERGTTAELISFLYIARGSAGEVRSMLCFVEQSPESGHLKSQISNLKSLAENCSRQLRGWTDHLQNSSIKGQRHLTAGERNRYAVRKEADEFQAKLAESLHRVLPHIYPDPHSED